jgi:hypothetical protein
MGPLRRSRNARAFSSAQSAWDNMKPDDDDEPELEECEEEQEDEQEAEK